MSFLSFSMSSAFAQTNTTATTTQPAPGAPGAMQGAPQQPSALGMLMPFAMMFGVIYFLIIRPQQKKMREQQEVLKTIKIGDEILTNSGIFGTVTGVTDQVLTVEIAEKVRVKMLRSQVATINPDLSNKKSLENVATR